MEYLGVDFIDESEVLTPADDKYHLDKQEYKVPFVCGARDLGEALRRISEGAAMIRSKGRGGSGNIVEAVRHMRAIRGGIAELAGAPGRRVGRACERHRRFIQNWCGTSRAIEVAGGVVLRRRRFPRQRTRR